MIDKRELRIGNWVQLLERKCKVDAIFITHFRARDINGIDLGDSLRTNYTPIPLTPEILEKVGFEFVNSQNRYGWYLQVDHRELCWCHSELISLEFKEGQFNEFNDTLFDFPCKHLHQLQNLIFCLTGEELAINL